eukprot:jgi/Astpho2/9815/Aster-x0871
MANQNWSMTIPSDEEMKALASRAGSSRQSQHSTGTPGDNEAERQALMQEADAMMAALDRDSIRLDLFRDLQDGIASGKRMAASSSISFVRLKGFKALTRVLLRGSDPLHPGVHVARHQALSAVLQSLLQAIKLPLKDPVQPLEGQLSSQNRWHAASVPERVAAAELLEGLCLLHTAAKTAAAQEGLLEALSLHLDAEDEELSCACAQALLAMLALHPRSMHQFLLAQHGGFSKVCLLLRRPDSPAALKMRLAELLVVTLSHLMSGDASHGPSQLVPQTGLRQLAMDATVKELGQQVANALAHQEVTSSQHVGDTLKKQTQQTLSALAGTLLTGSQ